MAEKTITLNIPDDGNEMMTAILQSILEQQQRCAELLERIAAREDVPNMLDHKAAAKYLGIGQSTLQLYKDKGEIPCIKSGTKKLYRRSDLDEWIKRHESKKGGQQ